MKPLHLALLAGVAVLASTTIVAAEPREVRVASHVSALSPLHQQSQIFAGEIKSRLPGQFDFKLFPGGQLGKEKALITNVKAGSLEMINVASGVMKLDKKLGLFDLQFVAPFFLLLYDPALIAAELVCSRQEIYFIISYAILDKPTLSRCL